MKRLREHLVFLQSIINLEIYNMINKEMFIFKHKQKNFGARHKEFILIYENDFPYPIDEICKDDFNINHWISDEQSKSSEERIFHKLTILFRYRKDIEYGILLLKNEAMENYDLTIKFQKIYKIDCYINYLFCKIQDEFLILLERKKETFILNIEETLFDEMLDYYQFYMGICI